MDESAHTLLDSDAVLEPFLQLAQDSAASNVSTIRTVVMKMLSDPKLFAGFDEIQQILAPRLTGAEEEPILRTLELFSYGTYKDYRQKPLGHFLPLADSHIFKLRQLTLLTAVQHACTGTTSAGSTSGGCVMSYQTLAHELGFIPDAATELDPAVLRQVEEVALSCIYTRVVAGQLCQKSAALVVFSRHGPPCRPRDVPLSNGAAMLATLQHFYQARLEQARRNQFQNQQAVQTQVDVHRQFWHSVQERKKRAESGGTASLLPGAPKWTEGGGNNGTPQQERRMSDTRRQPKRSRGGVSGAGSFTTAFQY